MRLACWSWGGREHAGIVSADASEVTPLALPAHNRRGVLPLVEALAEGHAMPPPAGARLPLAAVTLRAPLPRPRRNLFCIGRNYHAHAQELAGTVFRDSVTGDDAWPIVFTKLPETVVGPHDAVRLPPPRITDQIDYESELAVVIGRGGRDIARSRAMDHVAGWTVVNDISARDVQVRHKQWHLGKSFDTFCPMGPWVVTADELDARDVRVQGWLTPAGGGTPELRQDGRTRDLIHGIESLIETCSRGITLLPGDVIATGTPSGVGMGFEPPRWLKAGDRFRVEIEGIGAIDNPFEAA